MSFGMVQLFLGLIPLNFGKRLPNECFMFVLTANCMRNELGFPN